ncbi:MAG: ATP-binding protein, partial [Bdellovibrionia bacterium]
MKKTKDDLRWLTGGGEMGKTIRSKDWSETPLGPIESWPQSLRTTVSLCLASSFPISIAWGKEHTQIYNDGYWPICGKKHPPSMGQNFSECWEAAWPVLGPYFERALKGETSFVENQRMFLDRNGYLEETFFTFSFSPIQDESGEIGGLFHPVTETTANMLNERRLRTLRDLATMAREEKEEKETCALITETLSANPFDLPLILVYLLDESGETAQLCGIAGLEGANPAAPQEIHLKKDSNSGWPLEEARTSKKGIYVDDIEKRFGNIFCRPNPESLQKAFVSLITESGNENCLGFVIAGISTRLPLNESYQRFNEMLSTAINSTINESRAYQRERKRAEDLAQIDKAKNTFFTNVSHEFRTPLTLILGPVENLLSQTREVLSASVKTEIEIIYRNSLRLLKLVNSLIDFSRLESGRVEANYQSTEIGTMTTNLASGFRSAIERSGLKYTVDANPLPSEVYIDHTMWENIVLNLISNAFKYTTKGEIKVALRQEETEVVLTISDTGTGISETELPKIFQRFYRVKDLEGRAFEGTGIGLALVKELIKLHGGMIDVSSTVGKGSIFTVKIPLGFNHLPEDQISKTKLNQRIETLAKPRITNRAKAFVQEALRWLPEGANLSASPGVSGQADLSLLQRNQPSTSSDASGNDSLTTKIKKKRILLADDNVDMTIYLKKLLEKNYELIFVTNGKLALEAIRSERPDLVVSDIMMPVMDGYGLLKEIKNNKATVNIPVIFLTARAGEESRIEGWETGAD